MFLWELYRMEVTFWFVILLGICTVYLLIDKGRR